MVPATTASSWRTLATPVKGRSMDEVLRQAKANYEVLLNPVFVRDPLDKNKSISVPGRFCTGRLRSDAFSDTGFTFDPWEVVKERYVVVPNNDLYERAEAIASAYGESATLDSCGVLDEGRKFFAIVATGSLEMVVSTGYDHIDSYIVAMTSHDGSIPICYYNLDVRRCNNAVYRLESAEADFSLRKRHTPNHSDNAVELSEVIHLRKAWTEILRQTMTSMLTPLSDQRFSDVLSSQWDPAAASSKSKREHIEEVRDTIQELYRADYNCGAYGYSRWAGFSAICEYVDFHRNIPITEAAQHALEVDNHNHRLKVALFKLLKP